MMTSNLSPQAVNFAAIWSGLAEGISKIITLTGVKGMPMVEDIYKLCTAQPVPYSEELYHRLREFLEAHVDKLREALLEHQSEILTDYLRKWKAYSTGCEYCHHIFRYLNNNWIRKRLEDSRNKLGGASYQVHHTTEVYEVLTLAMVIWKERLFSRVKERLIRNLLDAITRERDGEQVNATEIRGVIESYVRLGMVNKSKPLEIYKEDFEIPFLMATREYYATESTAFIAHNGVSAYMRKAESRIEEESLRGKRYLDPSSCDKLKKEMDIVLIDRHRDAIQIECEPMLRDEKHADLTRMFKLLSRVEDGVKPMLDTLQSYIEHFGFDALKGLRGDAASPGTSFDPKGYVETLLAVHAQFSDVVKKCFANDAAFVASLDRACRKVVNDNPMHDASTKTPELLARYCDMLLKKQKMAVEEKQLEEKLGQIIVVFKYVDDKDVFQKFYSKMLARRLIHGVSVSLDMESVMIGGLKQACGYEYTSKLQRMFTDMSYSSEFNEKFKQYRISKHIDLHVDMTVLVLTQGSWPLHDQQASFAVPQELEACITEFHQYYNMQHHGRKLHWLHHLSKADVRTNYLRKKYEIQTTGYQLAVLVMFNSADVLSVEDIRRGTGLKENDLKRTVQSLVEAGLLRKKGAERERNPPVDEADTMVLNKTFQSKRLKLKITAAVTGDTPVQHQQTLESIEEDRKLYLQAAIVRIMKARKVLTHAQLVQETIQQSRTRFSPNISMIKKCIEQLIEKEYLARVENETNKYSYVA